MQIDASNIEIGGALLSLEEMLDLGQDIVECELSSIELTNINADNNDELIIYDLYQWVQADVAFEDQNNDGVDETQVPGNGRLLKMATCPLLQ